MAENHSARRQLSRLKWYVAIATVGLITLLEVFYLTAMKVPPLECLVEWVVATGLALVLIQLTFRVIFRQQDRVEQQARELVAELAARKWSQETIRRLAYQDPLTGLPNRALFNDRLDVALARASSNDGGLAVMLMGLDHFKTINDTLGHTTGDGVLQGVGARLTDTLRKGDTVCRMGGDELLLLPGLENSVEAGVVADKILAAVKESFLVDDIELRITTSLGAALYPDDGRERDTLVRSADIAMYQVKANGRDGYQFHADILQP